MRSVIAIAVLAISLGLAPSTAQASPLPGPTQTAPASGSTVDQPVFRWGPVTGAGAYEIQVALDQQFVTLTDSRTISGTTYAPTFSYTAKTMYWHVRALAPDATPGDWSATTSFTRRWTNDDEPAGTDVGGQPASRVEGFGLIGGGTTPALNKIGFTWEPVPGAAYYEVQFSNGPHFQAPDDGGGDSYLHAVCVTPHNSLTPYHTGAGYIRRAALGEECAVNSPFRPAFTNVTWTANGDRVVVDGTGVKVGDKVVVKYDPAGPEQTVAVVAVTKDPATGAVTQFSVPNTGAPAGTQGDIWWFKVELNFEPGQTYYARVRAVDAPTGPDYPAAPVYGLWSDQRREPTEPKPIPFSFTPGQKVGSGPMDAPALPTVLSSSGTDLPVLRWTPAAGADGYKVVIALDRDFTDRVGIYYTRSERLIPDAVYDDNGPADSYYWFALPCTAGTITLICDIADREAINDPAYVGRFAKRSHPVTGLGAVTTDAGFRAELRWHDALTAAMTSSGQTPGGVTSYEVQITPTTWSAATSVTTDNLMLNTSTLPTALGPGAHRWRVRPLDGQAVPLAWAEGPGFTIAGGTPDNGTDPSPTPTPQPSWNPNYDQTNGNETTSQPAAPGKPGKPAAERLNHRKIRLQWRASSEMGAAVSGYRVYRSTDGTHFMQVGKPAVNRVKLRAKRGKTYWFYVVADSAAGQSDPSRATRYRMPR